MTCPNHTRHRALAANLLIALLALLLVAAPTRAEEGEGSAWDVPLQAYDVVLVRPIGFVGLVASTSLFAFAGPIGATYGQFHALWELYVEDPFEFTFRRPIGDFD
jgi:hypothetical protein